MGRLPYSRHVTFIDYAIKEPLTRFRLFSNPVKPISRALQFFLFLFFEQPLQTKRIVRNVDLIFLRFYYRLLRSTTI